MKKSSLLVAVTLVFAQGAASADEIVEVRPDRMVGGGFGALSGFMLGAAGGPIGALAGGALGFYAGQGVQGVAGLEQNLYVIKAEDGSVVHVRSAPLSLSVGQQIVREGSRLTASGH